MRWLTLLCGTFRNLRDDDQRDAARPARSPGTPSASRSMPANVSSTGEEPADDRAGDAGQYRRRAMK